MPLYLGRDELYVSDAQPLEELGEAVVNHGDGKGGPAEVQRFSWLIEWEPQGTVEAEEISFAELPGSISWPDESSGPPRCQRESERRSSISS